MSAMVVRVVEGSLAPSQAADSIAYAAGCSLDHREAGVCVSNGSMHHAVCTGSMITDRCLQDLTISTRQG